MTTPPQSLEEMMNGFDVGDVEEVLFNAADTGPWRTTLNAEYLFVESGEVIVECAYGDAGSTIDSVMDELSSRVLPAGMHYRLSAVNPAILLRMRRP